MADKNQEPETEKKPAAKKKSTGGRKRKSSRAMYEELFVNAALEENEHLSPKNAENIDGPELLWALLDEYMQNPKATTQQRPLSLQLLAACLNFMQQSQVDYNLLEHLQRTEPRTKLQEPGREYPVGNGGITREDIAKEIVLAHQKDFPEPLPLQRLLMDIEKNDYFGRLI